MTENRERYYFLDVLRAVAIINMVIYHFLYDIFVIFGGDNYWYRKTGISIWEFFICSLFILISGMVWSLSKNHLKRGIILNVCGLIVSLITVFFIPEESIWFGILNFLGCAALIMIPLDFAVKKVNSYVGIIISIFLYTITYKSLIRGYIGVGEVIFFEIPEYLKNNFFLVPFGFPCREFRSSDYFPILPWFFMYLSGYFIWKGIIVKLAEKFEKFNSILKYDLPVLGAIGRKSLWIYLLHQPVCFGTAYLLCNFGRNIFH